jgi:BlaI family transcriptional regulator, penicillinase repressor
VLIFLHVGPPTARRMDPAAPQTLSRRERQIMDILFRRGEATAADVMDDLPDPPTYSAVRAALRLLVEKGTIEHRLDGKRYVYHPTTPRSDARSSALRHLLRTFFNGSPEQVVNTLLEDTRPSDAELARLARLIEQARRDEEGRDA